MPSAAKRATEKQFVDLLSAASQNLGIGVQILTVDDFLNRTDDTFRALRDVRPDALIVTGDEPQSAAMTDEPLWPALARLVDWAGDNTISSVWSCLAAHAAVFRLDRIARKRLPEKLSGMFACSTAADHELLAQFPATWLVPHSRHNSLDEAELQGNGYTVLSHAARIGADSFVKQVRSSLFMFMQGHPEYAPDSLFREYRRDIRRFLAGERCAYPAMPENYFDPQTVETLTRLRDQAHRSPSPRLLAAVYAAFTAASVQTSNGAPMRLYANWLAHVAEQKADRQDAARWSARRRLGAA
jgi:homoserine O-succinyltransferase